MVLTKSELIRSLQNEVRILLHLANKIDRSTLDYRPSPNQRSTMELLKYMSVMGPAMVNAARSGFDRAAWTAATQAADARGFDQTLETIAAQAALYPTMLADMSDEELREEIDGMDGRKTTRGAFIVNLVLSGYAAYRMQLFLYLKACGRDELSTMNLWGGVDAPVAAA